MASKREWSVAYARQAQADFETFYRLQKSTATPECHRLHFLQMSCEKLVKAHLCRVGAEPALLQTSHAYVAKNLPIALREQLDLAMKRAKQFRWLVLCTKKLSEEIEILSPSVTRGLRRPDNCEYPWIDSADNLHIPLDWTFYTAQLLDEAAGRTILKLIHAAIIELLA